MVANLLLCKSCIFILMNILMLMINSCSSIVPPISCPPNKVPICKNDVDLLQFAMNLEYLEAEFFLRAAFGYGLDKFAPQLAMGGPPPIGGRKANLDFLTQNIITEFGYEEVGHLRALQATVGGFPRPLIDLSVANFAKVFDDAIGYRLVPPFDPYRDSLSFMLTSYLIPYLGLVGYVGTNPNLNGYESKSLLAGLLGVEAGQDAVIRTYLYERADLLVLPYDKTVAEFTDLISKMRNRLANTGIKDEGIVVPPALGAENKTSTNILSANFDSLSYQRAPAEILRIVYGTGDEHRPGGVFPRGANGIIARSFL